MPKYDFTGWASKANVLCSDGTTIRDGCFAQQDGETVPLVYMHNHNDIGQVLGHAILHAVNGGTRVEGYFNNSPAGQAAKEALQNGDISSLSIWANQLKRKAGDIYHGVIKEVSIVIGGADPEARIDSVVAHGELSEDEAEIWGFGAPEIAHADDEEDEEEEMTEETNKKEDNANSEETVKDVFNTLTDKQKKAVAIIVGQILKEQKDNSDNDTKPAEKKEEKKPEEKSEVEHTDNSDDAQNDEGEDEETVKDVYDTLNEKQKKVVAFLVGAAIKQAKNSKNDEGDTTVKHNVFEDGAVNANNEYLSHDDMAVLIKDAKTLGGGSMREAFRAAVESGAIAHADPETNGTMGTDYGFNNVDYLFPDARSVNNQPDFVTRNMDWVDQVLGAVHRTPFSRVKSVHANLTEDEARARGYIKGNFKKEQVFKLLKRSTDPQTVYKKQKMDKQDIDDITEFNVLAWMRTEMQFMLREEVARAILIGDGRPDSDDAKIEENHIRPVYDDDDFYTIKFAVEVPEFASDDEKAMALMRAQLKARKLYKGSGNMTFYTTEDNLTSVLLLENGIGERMYKSEAEIATAMRVAGIQTLAPMEGLQIEIPDSTGGTKTKYDVAGIDVNLIDYNIGTNGGAKTDFFDDFDLNYNQQICLYETRLSGAMIKPMSAITFYFKPVKKTTPSGPVQ